ncbi:beta-xylosidase, partial [bacterium]|nr:beta-xylosidase [bacterium]
RDLATNGVDKPVLNVFRMFGMMKGRRVKVSGDLAYSEMDIVEKSVRGAQPDVNAMASCSEQSASVLVWNYHDLNQPAEDSTVEVKVKGFPTERVLVHHYRIDNEHSNSYELWKKMGSPQNPTADQYAELEASGQLQLLTSPSYISLVNHEAVLKMELPRQGVSLLRFTW